MKLHLKGGEHLRIQHDAPGGQFRVWIGADGTLHITAVPREERPLSHLIVTEQPIRVEH